MARGVEHHAAPGEARRILDLDRRERRRLALLRKQLPERRSRVREAGLGRGREACALGADLDAVALRRPVADAAEDDGTRRLVVAHAQPQAVRASHQVGEVGRRPLRTDVSRLDQERSGIGDGERPGARLHRRRDGHDGWLGAGRRQGRQGKGECGDCGVAAHDVKRGRNLGSSALKGASTPGRSARASSARRSSTAARSRRTRAAGSRSRRST